MLLVDLFLRFPSLTISIILIVLMARDAGHFRQARIAIALLLTIVASSLHTLPAELRLPVPLHVIALFVSVPAAALQWWFARSVLEDQFQPGWSGWSVMGAACLFKLGWSLQGIGINPPAYEFRYAASYTVTIGLAAHIIWMCVAGLKDDLVEQRRRVRLWFVFFIALTGMVNLVMEMMGYSGAVEAIFIHATSLPMLIWALLWLVTLSPGKIFYVEPVSREDKSFSDIPLSLRPAYQRLINTMEDSSVYRDHGLSIGTLAPVIDLPEHQLRRLINQAMGYRNFSAFLNTYRIAYAKSALSDPDQVRKPILTIALDAGYKTLSTFNRAFKSMEGETPSTYRERVLGNGMVSAACANLKKSEQN